MAPQVPLQTTRARIYLEYIFRMRSKRVYRHHETNLLVAGEASFRTQHQGFVQAELAGILKDYVGRESPLYYAERLSDAYVQPNGSKAEIFFKREDLNHTGAHKINNSLGQVLLCKRMGKKRVIAETGAGQHGVATATVCARYGIECIVYMGAKDMERQALNVFRMRLMGAEVLISLYHAAYALISSFHGSSLRLKEHAALTHCPMNQAVHSTASQLLI